MQQPAVYQVVKQQQPMNRNESATGKGGRLRYVAAVSSMLLYINTHTPYCRRRHRCRMSKELVDDSITPHRRGSLYCAQQQRPPQLRSQILPSFFFSFHLFINPSSLFF